MATPLQGFTTPSLAGAANAPSDFATFGGEVEKRVVMRFATAADRDAAITVPEEGMVVALTSDNLLTYYTGSAWTTLAVPHGALTTYTPTLTQSATPTKTVNNASYQRTGRLITSGLIKMTATSAGTANNAIVVGLPVAAAASADTAIGSGSLYDASVPAWYPFLLVVASSTTARLLDCAAAFVGPLFLGQTGTSMSAAVASPDIITYSFNYEAAAD